MKLFHRRKTILEVKDRQLWKTVKLRLKDAGVKSVRCGSYDSEPPVCG